MLQIDSSPSAAQPQPPPETPSDSSSSSSSSQRASSPAAAAAAAAAGSDSDSNSAGDSFIPPIAKKLDGMARTGESAAAAVKPSSSQPAPARLGSTRSSDASSVTSTKETDYTAGLEMVAAVLASSRRHHSEEHHATAPPSQQPQRRPDNMPPQATGRIHAASGLFRSNSMPVATTPATTPNQEKVPIHVLIANTASANGPGAPPSRVTTLRTQGLGGSLLSDTEAGNLLLNDTSHASLSPTSLAPPSGFRELQGTDYTEERAIAEAIRLSLATGDTQPPATAPNPRSSGSNGGLFGRRTDSAGASKPSGAFRFAGGAGSGLASMFASRPQIKIVLDSNVAEVLVAGPMIPPAVGWLPDYDDPMHHRRARRSESVSNSSGGLLSDVGEEESVTTAGVSQSESSESVAGESVSGRGYLFQDDAPHPDDELPDYMTPPREIVEDGVLSGNVVVKMDKPATNIKGISVRIVGLLEVDSFSVVNARIGADAEPIARKVMAREVVVHRWNPQEEIQPGTHKFSFATSIPGGCPPTTMVPYINIKYTIDAVFVRQDGSYITSDVEHFHVIRVRRFDPAPGQQPTTVAAEPAQPPETQEESRRSVSPPLPITARTPSIEPHAAADDRRDPLPGLMLPGAGTVRRRSPSSSQPAAPFTRRASSASLAPIGSMGAATFLRRTRAKSPGQGILSLMDQVSSALSGIGGAGGQQPARGDRLDVAQGESSRARADASATSQEAGEADHDARTLATTPVPEPEEVPAAEVATSGVSTPASGLQTPAEAAPADTVATSRPVADQSASTSTATTLAAGTPTTTPPSPPSTGVVAPRNRRGFFETLFSATALTGADEIHPHVPYRATYSGITDDGVINWECSLLPALPADAKELTLDLVLRVMRADTDLETGCKRLEHIVVCVKEVTVFKVVIVSRNSKRRSHRKVSEERVRGKATLKPTFSEMEPSESMPAAEDLRFKLTLPINMRTPHTSQYTQQNNIYTTHTGKPLNLLPDLVEREVERHNYIRISVPYTVRKRPDSSLQDWYQGSRRSKVAEITVPFKVVVLAKDAGFPWDLGFAPPVGPQVHPARAGAGMAEVVNAVPAAPPPRWPEQAPQPRAEPAGRHESEPAIPSYEAAVSAGGGVAPAGAAAPRAAASPTAGLGSGLSFPPLLQRSVSTAALRPAHAQIPGLLGATTGGARQAGGGPVAASMSIGSMSLTRSRSASTSKQTPSAVAAMAAHAGTAPGRKEVQAMEGAAEAAEEVGVAAVPEIRVEDVSGTIKAGKTEVVRELLLEDKSLVSAKHKDPTAKFDSEVELDAYKFLGAYIGQITPLQLAILCGQDSIARDILDRSVQDDLDITFGGGNTTLHLATFLGAYDLVKALLERGANRTLKNSKGFAPVDVLDDGEMRALYQ
ncbi:hypothetical protein HDU96_010217 [Phlyctochytrium bullatum]|nr:hypothetical protein HDU96_010217 [Phlyctochytrium bullatum]